MLNLKNRSIAASAALVATAITLVAATPISAATPSVKVAYGDLNLRSDAGVDTFNARVRNAARAVCNHGVSPVDAASCRVRTVASAQSKVAMAKVESVQLASR